METPFFPPTKTVKFSYRENGTVVLAHDDAIHDQDARELNTSSMSSNSPTLPQALKPHATIMQSDTPASCLMPAVQRCPLRVGMWYFDRDPCRSTDPFDLLFSRQEWDGYCEKEEQRKREEMFTARIRQQAQELEFEDLELDSEGEMTISEHTASATSPRKCKAVTVRGNGGKARTVRLWCKDREEQAALQLKAKMKKSKFMVSAKDRSTTPTPIECDGTGNSALPVDYIGSYSGVACRRSPRKRRNTGTQASPF
ncbi:hypothetical protein E1B28_011616 [Marasmius oreades]|uniref:Uncharacterized protein n=1 Tax=Marasmius oreades TaxID=181124 RepID=A0A9P7RUG1_9AGAR|nr:uncharacterized protein E1B28_011616 [Marasmius oreades]KAG7089994.1 hypothetical protein E1B28_011616 [Marasmius oreades]